MNAITSGRMLKCLIMSIMIVCLALSANATALASGKGDALVLAAAQGTSPQASAPDFQLPDLDGNTYTLSKYKGQKPVLLYFWATWCPYCVEAKPKIAKLRESISPDQLEILGINVGEGDSLERVKRFQKGHPSSWPILYDEGGKISRQYQVQGIPLFILLNKDGNVVYRENVIPAEPMQYLK